MFCLLHCFHFQGRSAGDPPARSSCRCLLYMYIISSMVLPLSTRMPVVDIGILSHLGQCNVIHNMKIKNAISNEGGTRMRYRIAQAPDFCFVLFFVKFFPMYTKVKCTCISSTGLCKYSQGQCVCIVRVCVDTINAAKTYRGWYKFVSCCVFILILVHPLPMLAYYSFWCPNKVRAPFMQHEDNAMYVQYVRQCNTRTKYAIGRQRNMQYEGNAILVCHSILYVCSICRRSTCM